MHKKRKIINKLHKQRKVYLSDQRETKICMILTELTIEISETFRPIFQALAFGTASKPTVAVNIVAVTL